MLVLSRKIGQQIVLPESGVNIAVLGVRGRRVQLGIDAPTTARVHRAEVWEQILAGSEPARKSAAGATRKSHGSGNSAKRGAALTGPTTLSPGRKNGSGNK
jgi:carbon storage regulator